MYNKVFGNEMTSLQRKGHNAVMIFGAVGGSCAFIFSVIELFNPAETD